MRANKFKNLLLFSVAASLLAGSFACNSHTDTETDIAITSSMVAVKKFSLKENSKIMNNLDSVFFSIDLDHGVIFNADSLPKGTDVTKLVPQITFANTLRKAELSFQRVNDSDTVVNYLNNKNDSIDFTYPVTLNVVAEDGTTEFSYTIKVNVHTQDPDTLIWDKMATSPFPSRLDSPVAQKTVTYQDKTLSLISESDGSLTLATSTDLFNGIWEKQQVTMPFTPDISSFTAGADNLYILDQNGLLYYSPDAQQWTSTSENWVAILGCYNSSVLGVKADGSGYLHTQYPLAQGYTETPLEDSFPISDFSQMGVVSTDWSPYPIAFIAGGVTSNGSLCPYVWAFDGDVWTTINATALPALKSPMLAKYVVFKDTPSAFAKRELDAWLLFGGIGEDGSFNHLLYYSINNGVTWELASDALQLPEEFPYLEGADVIVADSALSADLSDLWKPMAKTRTDYTVDGTVITWDCPYMYVFGGYLENNSFNNLLWRGVINRLRFSPSI